MNAWKIALIANKWACFLSIADGHREDVLPSMDVPKDNKLQDYL
jgi:hypothetical protein